MNKQLVSILIHTYNRHQLAIKAVRSALAQTYRSIEIVVTDDSDTDLLGDMLMSIGDKRIRYVKNSERIGLVFNARKAFQISNGEYCLFLPNDDYLTNPFYIEDAVEIFNNNKINLIIPDCIFSYNNKDVIGSSGYQGLVAGKDFIHNLWVEAHIPHCGNIFRRDTVQRLNPFHSSDILWSEIEIWIKLMSIGDVYCYSIPSILYLFHDDNTVLTMSRDELITNSKFIRSSMEAFADDNLITEIVIRYLCAINNLGSSVDSEFIANVTKFNQIENNINYVYEQFYSRYKENIQK